MENSELDPNPKGRLLREDFEVAVAGLVSTGRNVTVTNFVDGYNNINALQGLLNPLAVPDFVGATDHPVRIEEHRALAVLAVVHSGFFSGNQVARP